MTDVKEPVAEVHPGVVVNEDVVANLVPGLALAADQAGGPQGPGRAAGEHEPVDDGVGRADMQPVAGGFEDGLLRELAGSAGLRWLPGTPALAPRNVSVLVIIAVLAAKCPGPNWIVSPSAAISTACASVAHAAPPGVHVASLPAVVT